MLTTIDSQNTLSTSLPFHLSTPQFTTILYVVRTLGRTLVATSCQWNTIMKVSTSWWSKVTFSFHSFTFLVEMSCSLSTMFRPWKPFVIQSIFNPFGRVINICYIMNRCQIPYLHQANLLQDNRTDKSIYLVFSDVLRKLGPLSTPSTKFKYIIYFKQLSLVEIQC